MDTTLPDSIFAATTADYATLELRVLASFYPPVSVCSECEQVVGVEDSRLVSHTHVALGLRLGTCPGSRSAVPLGQAEGRLVSAILEKLATDRGLRWTISYEGLDGEPKAFRLVCDGRTMFHLPQVIGETEFEARECISLAGQLAGHG